jgi:indolepyruvate ferredoxin oxidoreductase, alpha subunit
MTEAVVLGGEAVALGALHAGITAAYGYPGTPSTEILDFLVTRERQQAGPRAAWCTNEKTAYEAALGVALVGRRALVTMKHVGLNVAADPFMNSALVGVHGGLVVAVADDPGMHSSQNEQDSRFYADFARVMCLEPATTQECYEMTRQAFDLSERFRIPVLLRLVTRLAHARGIITTAPSREQNPIRKTDTPSSWILLPMNARRQWHGLVTRQKDLRAHARDSQFNRLDLHDSRLGIVTAGIARTYLRENLDDLSFVPSQLHVGEHPIPEQLIEALTDHVDSVLVLEDGYPFLERVVRAVAPDRVTVRGRESGDVPAEGELDADVVRAALGLGARESLAPSTLTLPARLPRLCAGCPHSDMYHALNLALADEPRRLVTSDVGCYTLGALPPYDAIETCVSMGASVGLAKGAADAGFRPVVAVIGDSTFLHSGMTPLLDAVVADTDMTLLILDNEVVAMTGGQASVVPSSRMQPLLVGLGVNPDHLRIVRAHPRHVEEIAAVIRQEVAHHGLSVIVGVRECVEAARAGKVPKVNLGRR